MLCDNLHNWVAVGRVVAAPSVLVLGLRFLFDWLLLCVGILPPWLLLLLLLLLLFSCRCGLGRLHAVVLWIGSKIRRVHVNGASCARATVPFATEASERGQPGQGVRWIL